MYSKLLHLFEIIDQSVAQIRREFPEEIRCKPGCADCCHAAFDVSFIEAGHLGSILLKDKALTTKMHGEASRAIEEYEGLIRSGESPEKARIRCPMLGNDDTCLCYEGRPINCRTYGTPTDINGKGHVCGFSGFQKGVNYPTISLAPIQAKIHNWSVNYAGEDFGNRRFPIALVILRPSRFAPE